MNPVRVGLLIGVVLSAAGMTCARQERPVARVRLVSITSFTFSPGELSVARGDTVVWTNSDFVPHSATARDTTWDSGSVAANASWRFVAHEAGRHEYYCVLHPTMRGTIVVR